MSQAIVLFDGYCNYCSGWADFIMRHDRCGYFKLGTLQSEAGQALLRQYHVPLDTDSVVLIENGQCYVKSDATARIMGHLSGPWPLFSGIKIVPRPIRNGVYDFIARNRYRWFGKRETCRVPNAAERDRFLE